MLSLKKSEMLINEIMELFFVSFPEGFCVTQEQAALLCLSHGANQNHPLRSETMLQKSLQKMLFPDRSKYTCKDVIKN